jgi:hypothetical protein
VVNVNFIESGKDTPQAMSFETPPTASCGDSLGPGLIQYSTVGVVEDG